LGIKRSDSVFFLPLLGYGGYGARPRRWRGPFRDQQISTIRIPQRKLINSSGTISRLISLGRPLLCLGCRLAGVGRESTTPKTYRDKWLRNWRQIESSFFFRSRRHLSLSLSFSLFGNNDFQIPRYRSRTPIDSRSTERHENQCHFGKARFGYSFSAERVAGDSLVLVAIRSTERWQCCFQERAK